MESKLFETLKEAYEISTHKVNHFADALASINWDEEFYADGEYYFVKGGFCFTTPSLNPFRMAWRPSAIFSDASFVSF